LVLPRTVNPSGNPQARNRTRSGDLSRFLQAPLANASPTRLRPEAREAAKVAKSQSSRCPRLSRCSRWHDGHDEPCEDSRHRHNLQALAPRIARWDEHPRGQREHSFHPATRDLADLSDAHPEPASGPACQRLL